MLLCESKTKKNQTCELNDLLFSLMYVCRKFFQTYRSMCISCSQEHQAFTVSETPEHHLVPPCWVAHTFQNICRKYLSGLLENLKLLLILKCVQNYFEFEYLRKNTYGGLKESCFLSFFFFFIFINFHLQKCIFIILYQQCHDIIIIF